MSEAKLYKVVVRVPDMDCPHESGEITELFEKDPRFSSMKFDHPARLATFELTATKEDCEKLPEAIQTLGMESEVVSIDEVKIDTSATKTVEVHVADMCCPAEGGQIERAFEGNDQVKHLGFDYGLRVAKFEVAKEMTDYSWILATIQSLGMEGEILEAKKLSDVTITIENMKTDADVDKILAVVGVDAKVDKTAHTIGVRIYPDAVFGLLEKLEAAGFTANVSRVGENLKSQVKTELPVKRLGSAFVFAAAAEVLELMGTVPEWAIIVCAAAAILLAGFDTVIKGLKSLVRLIFNMNTLMAVAVIGACALGAWPEAAMVMVLYEIGETIEDMCMVKAKNAIRNLLDVTPETVLANVNGTWKRLAAETVPAGTIYRIEPGERAGLDGTVVEGHGAMDESMMTGESLPSPKEPGSRVYAGALTLDSTLTVKATAAASDSMSARIIRSVEDAEQKKAPLQRFVDRFAARYTPTVFALAILTALIGPWVSNEPWTEWIYRALVLLVISCPCALVISTPVTIVSALSLAARRGILVKGGVFLEAGRFLKHVALDKTGTVTRGKPTFDTMIAVAGNDPERAFLLGASLAGMSSHPISKAISEELAKRELTPMLVTNFKALPGFGTEGTIEGVKYRFTNLRWLEDKKLATDEVKAAFAKAYDEGKSAVAVSDMFGVLAVFIVADTLKPNAKDAIDAMKRADLTPWLLTGDNTRAATSIAAQVGIDNVKAELLPDQKLNEIDRLDNLAPTAMAGDGINDAPALSRARIGFAMGIKGSDSAIEAADVALMDDNIGKIAWFKRLSELTHRTLVQNIVFALGVKFGFAVAAIAGHASMWAAVFADTGVCLIVVAWGLRLMKAGAKVDAMTER